MESAPSIPRISDSEWTVMRVFWSKGEATSSEAVAALEDETHWKPKTIQTLIRRMPVSESVLDAILRLVRSARPGNGNEFADQKVAWGPGPRAGQALMLTARARALYEGRFAPSVDDVVALAGPVLQHRMALTFAARADGASMKEVIAKLVAPLRG